MTVPVDTFSGLDILRGTEFGNMKFRAGKEGAMIVGQDSVGIAIRKAEDKQSTAVIGAVSVKKSVEKVEYNTSWILNFDFEKREEEKKDVGTRAVKI